MKKLALILATVLVLTACERAAITELGEVTNQIQDEVSDTHANVPESTEITEITAVSHNSSDGLVIPAQWVTEHGAYFVSHTDGDCDCDPDMRGHLCDSPMLLHMTDSATGNTFVLCNRPECLHDSASCNAYLPADVFETLEIELTADSERDFRNNRRSATLLFTDDSHIFVINGHNTIYRFNLDGTGRTEAMRIPAQYAAGCCCYIRGWLLETSLSSHRKLYIHANVINPVADGSGFVFRNSSVILEIDYRTGAVREVYSWEEQSHIVRGERRDVSVLGIWEGEIFFFESHLDGNVLEVVNSAFFSINPENGDRTDIYSGLFNLGDTVTDRAEVSFYSISDDKMLRLNLLTGEVFS
jgi:hypothetical protein